MWLPMAFPAPPASSSPSPPGPGCSSAHPVAHTRTGPCGLQSILQLQACSLTCKMGAMLRPAREVAAKFSSLGGEPGK